MGNLGEELRKEAEKKKAAAAKRAAKERSKKVAEHNAEVDRRWAEIEPTLEEIVRKAHKKNYSGGFEYEGFGTGIGNEWNAVEQSLAWKIKGWCESNGLFAEISHHEGQWDWPASDHLYIYWEQPRPRYW